MHGPIKVKSPNNISEWQMGFNSAFKGLIRVEFFRHILEKYSDIKFQDNPSSGIQVVSCGRMDGRTDMAKLRVAFRNFV